MSAMRREESEEQLPEQDVDLSEGATVLTQVAQGIAHAYLVPKALALIGSDHICVAVDEGFCQVFGRTAAELVGKSVTVILSDMTLDGLAMSSIDRCFLGEITTHSLFLMDTGDGLQYLNATYEPCRDAQGQVFLAAMIVHDASTNRAAEQLLLQYVQRHETMHELDRAILGERPPAEVARRAVACVQKLVPAAGACVTVVDELLASSSFQNTTGFGEELPRLWQGAGQDPLRPWVRVLACTEDPLFGDVAGNVIRLPLTLQNETLGELILEPRFGRQLDDEHLEILQQIAGRMARALHHALIREKLRRYTLQLEQVLADRMQEIERRRQAAEGLREILGFLNSNRPLGEILDHVFKQAELLLGADAVAVFSPVDVRDPVVDAGNCIFVHSSLPAHIGEAEYATIDAAVKQAVSSLAPITVFVAPTSPYAFAAHLVVPMQAERGVFGVIAYYFADQSNLTAESIDLAVALSEQVVLATESERLQRRAEDAALLEERERLAQELHDAVTQSIYSLTLFAEAGRRQASAGQLDRVQEYLTLLGDTAQQAMKQMRLMLYELRPAVLEQVGLVGALRQRLDAVERRAGISARLEVAEPLWLPPAVEEGLYRICQEALNNALKHASAQEVVVRLHLQDHVVTLEIDDDGVGFVLDDVEQADSAGLGLNHIRERAARMNAALTIDTAPDHGTHIKLSLAIPPNGGVLIRQGAPAAL